MKWLITIVAVGFTAAIGLAADNDAKAEMKKLEGNWEVVSIEANGMKIPVQKGAPEKALIANGKATFYSDGKAMPTFKDLGLELDPKKSPKEVNLVRGKGETLPCIYELSDTELKIAMPLVPLDRKPEDKLERPNSFATKDKPVMVLTVKRVK
jgi:uncharacterized protein (TIGR03067 family)